MKVKTTLVCLVALVSAFLVVLVTGRLQGVETEPRLSPYPSGADFAFTITDDPDASRFDEAKLVYDFLKKERLRTTIALWIREATRTNGIPDLPMSRDFGVTCENAEYLEYLKLLQKSGFEIALHTISGGNDLRETTRQGYNEFKLLFGTFPKVNIMHMQNLENVYWGKKVFGEGILSRLVGLFVKRSNLPFQGEDPASPYFCGDILKANTKYVRLWGTSDINTLAFNPSMPYHDPEKPYVNFWFSFSDGFGLEGFTNLVSEDNIAELAQERGACILYTHFAHGFVQDGKLDEGFKHSVNQLVSQPDGWFVPVSDLLDRLLLMKRVLLTTRQNGFMVVNLNEVKVEGVTVLVAPREVWYGFDCKEYGANQEGEIILGTLESGEGLVLLKDKASTVRERKHLGSVDVGMTVIEFRDAIYVSKGSASKPAKLSPPVFKGRILFDVLGHRVETSEDGEILLPDLNSQGHVILIKEESVLDPALQYPTSWEYFNMIFQRALLYVEQN